MNFSAALTTETHEALVEHLDRADGHEDLCFALYRPSQGVNRHSAVVHELLLPAPGERNVHGNVAFTGDYFLRGAFAAADADAGLVLLHSHPKGRGWQGMSRDDIEAEHGHAAQAVELTDLPLLGMTLGTGEASWSARFWERVGRGQFERRDCESVRVVGDQLRLTFNPDLRPAPRPRPSQARTVSSWGELIQADIARLRVGIIGVGSVGSIVAEALARTGVEHIRLIDFDSVEERNLDRILHAGMRDVRLARSKVEVVTRALRQSSTAAQPQVEGLDFSVVEEAGFRTALDCDLLFSCVDRPWPRAVANLIAYAHLIPVVDGGIRVVANDTGLVRADWKAHVAVPGRACLECLKQYAPEDVALEREGHLDDPEYVKGLPKSSPLRSGENVFAFAASTASFEVLQMLSMIVAPQGIADVGAGNFHFVTGELDIDTQRVCGGSCLYSGPFLATAERSGITVTAQHPAAEHERERRRERQRQLGVRIRRKADDLVWRLQR